MGFIFNLSCASILILAVSFWYQKITDVEIPSHLFDHQAFYQENLIPPDIAIQLMDLVKNATDFHTNVDQSKAQGFTPKYEHIGEAEPINTDGTCTNTFLFPNWNSSQCILPQRIDIGKHYVMTGGLDGTKENFDELVDRVSSFGQYNFISDLDEYPPVKALFENPDFVKAALSVCPDHAQVMDPFQFNFIIQVPGQTVAVHIDSSIFFGATRFDFPQWLLVTMVFSNLFKDKFVDQVQVVGYIHDWSPAPGDKTGGEFVYFTNKTSIGVAPCASRSGTLVDGSKVLHAAKLYRPDVKAPHLDKDKSSSLRYVANDNWVVQSDEEIIQRYTTKDLRIAIVYRARCFASEESRDKFINQGPDDVMDLEEVLSVLKADMISKGLVTKQKLDRMSRFQLATLLMDSYVKYPLPPKELALIPYNYCALSKLIPWTAPLLSLIC